MIQISTKMNKILADFRTYKDAHRDTIETFTFWDDFIKLVSLLNDLIPADREGDWQLHLNTVQSILSLFALYDRTNYLRWASLYLEDMRKLPETAPDVYESFQAGKVVVKRSSGYFTAVGVDMCLEQTINRSQKSSSGIIGASRRKTFVAEWELIYHELLAVTTHCECNKSEIDYFEQKIPDMIEYVESNENPFASCTEKTLHNILSEGWKENPTERMHESSEKY